MNRGDFRDLPSGLVIDHDGRLMQEGFVDHFTGYFIDDEGRILKEGLVDSDTGYSISESGEIFESRYGIKFRTGTRIGDDGIVYEEGVLCDAPIDVSINTLSGRSNQPSDQGTEIDSSADSGAGSSTAAGAAASNSSGSSSDDASSEPSALSYETTPVFAIALSALLVVTWIFFPSIGGRETSLAKGPLLSYLWPIAFVWVAYLAEFGKYVAKPERPQSDFASGLLYFSAVSIIAACWALWIWNNLAARPDGFLKFVIQFFGSAILGLPVLVFYWGAMIVSAGAMVAAVPSIVRAVKYLSLSKQERQVRYEALLPDSRKRALQFANHPLAALERVTSYKTQDGKSISVGDYYADWRQVIHKSRIRQVQEFVLYGYRSESRARAICRTYDDFGKQFTIVCELVKLEGARASNPKTNWNRGKVVGILLNRV